MLSKLIERAKSALPAETPITEDQLKQAGEAITDTRRPIGIGLTILGAGLTVFLLWAFLAPLDEGVPAAGTVAVESKRKVVQHLTGGIVKKILVKESQEVEAGEPLVLLDDTTSKANFDATREQYYALQAQTDRLHAEAIKADKITFSQPLLDAADNPVANQNMVNQRQLFLTRRAALQGELAILEASARSAEEQIRGVEAQARGKMNSSSSSANSLRDRANWPRKAICRATAGSRTSAWPPTCRHRPPSCSHR